MYDYEYNDYELLDYISENNEDASSILYDKYKNVIEKIAKNKMVLNRGLDLNDLIQEGMIGFSEAIRDFKNQKDVTFYTFACVCIERQILSAIRAASRSKYRALNDSISLDYSYDEDNNLYDVALDSRPNPLDYIVGVEEQSKLYDTTVNNLSEFEKKVFDLRIKNFSYKEISEILHVDIKKIDNAVQRIKSKTSSVLSDK